MHQLDWLFSRSHSSAFLRSLSPSEPVGPELLLIDRSFQSPPLPALRIQRRDVVPALPRDFETELPQALDHSGPVLDHAVRDAPAPEVPAGAIQRPGAVEPGDQYRLFQRAREDDRSAPGR